MPITWEWQYHVEDKIRPYGKQRWQDVVIDRARQALNGRARAEVLEAGCGKECWITRTLRSEGWPMHVMGVDIDPVCTDNRDVDTAIVCSLTEMGLETESVDLVMGGWVMEHLENPHAALKSIQRVLKRGGCAILWTPNIWNPATIVSCLTPQKFHSWWRKLSHGEEHAENAGTYYRMNTLGRLKRGAEEAGFIYESGRAFSSAYQYFRMCKFTYVVACILNRPAVFWPLNRLGLTLVVVLRKPAY